jgi:hypothetical protein
MRVPSAKCGNSKRPILERPDLGRVQIGRFRSDVEPHPAVGYVDSVKRSHDRSLVLAPPGEQEILRKRKSPPGGGSECCSGPFHILARTKRGADAVARGGQNGKHLPPPITDQVRDLEKAANETDIASSRPTDDRDQRLSRRLHERAQSVHVPDHQTTGGRWGTASHAQRNWFRRGGHCRMHRRRRRPRASPALSRGRSRCVSHRPRSGRFQDEHLAGSSRSVRSRTRGPITSGASGIRDPRFPADVSGTSKSALKRTRLPGRAS